MGLLKTNYLLIFQLNSTINGLYCLIGEDSETY